MTLRAARLLSSLFQPVLTGTYVLLAVSIADADTWVAAVGWGLGLAALTAGVPTFDILRRVRGNTVTDFHIAVREQRLRPLLVALGCTAAGLVLVLMLGGPRAVSVALSAALVTGGVLTVVTRVWKISFHAATAASAVVLLTWVLGPWALVTLLLPPAIAWSRVRLARHTPAQVAAGAVTGLVLTAAVVALGRPG